MRNKDRERRRKENRFEDDRNDNRKDRRKDNRERRRKNRNKRRKNRKNDTSVINSNTNLVEREKKQQKHDERQVKKTCYKCEFTNHFIEICSKYKKKSKNQKIKKSKNLIVFIQIQQQKINFIDIDDTFESIFNEKFDCFIESLNVAKTIRRRFRRIQIKTIKIFAKRKFVIIFFINIDVIFEKEHEMQILLNNENQINLISRNLMQRFKLSSKHLEFVRVKTINESILRTYEIHFLNLKVKNQINIVRYFIEFF